MGIIGGHDSGRNRQNLTSVGKTKANDIGKAIDWGKGGRSDWGSSNATTVQRIPKLPIEGHEGPENPFSPPLTIHVTFETDVNSRYGADI